MATYILFGKKVNNPFLKLLAVALPLTLIAISLPVLVPAHYILRKLNRNGFWFRHRVQIGKESFKKQGYW